MLWHCDTNVIKYACVCTADISPWVVVWLSGGVVVTAKCADAYGAADGGKTTMRVAAFRSFACLMRPSI